MPWGVIRQDQYGRLARAHEIACHGPDEVGVGPVHFGQEPVDHVHGDVRPALDQFRTPALHVVLVAEFGISGRNPLGCTGTAATTRSGARSRRFQMKGPAMQKPSTMNLSMPR